MESEARADTRLFRQVVSALLRDGIAVRFRAHGRSMFPAVRDGEVVQVDPATAPVVTGTVAMIDGSDGLRVHRVVDGGTGTIGDCCLEQDGKGTLLGSVSVVKQSGTCAIAALSLGTRVRRWLARWRGHF